MHVSLERATGKITIDELAHVTSRFNRGGLEYLLM
jgi:hypothetical protein